jgi:hypothetical protein
MPSKDALNDARLAAAAAAAPLDVAGMRYQAQAPKTAAATPSNFTYGQNTAPAYVAPTLAELEKQSSDSLKASIEENKKADELVSEGDRLVAEAKKAAEDAAKKDFPKVGTLLRYDAGSEIGTRIPVYADGVGGEFMGEESINPVVPGSTGFEKGTNVTLARNTFANSIALAFGETEATQPWVGEIYDLMQGYLNTGSTVEEAQNLALREAKNKGVASKFTQRFSAVFKLQDRLNAGETVQVPSIADYVKSEQQLGDVLRIVGLGDLATQEISAKILGDANKSVSEATALIQDVFGAIDNAPEALKRDLQVLAPGVDRTSIAKALLLGKQGADALMKQVNTISQVSAAKTQGVTISSAVGADLAAGGETYGTSLGKFATVKQLERGQQLGRMSNIDFTQQEAIDSAFGSSAAADEKIRKIYEEERNRFSAQSGRLPSQNRSKDF